MPDFTSPEAMVEALQARLTEAVPKLPQYTEIAKLIADDARDRIGKYQDASGPFPVWAPLSTATQDAREKLGYSRDEPLLRKGTLRDHIAELPTEVSAVVAVPSEMVETTDNKTVDIADIADWQEHGTPSIPPRPFLGPALFAKRLEALEIIERSIARKFEE